jgi:hypothetical protein
MRLEKASRKAVDYACKKFHYSQNAAPRAHDLAFSVFENGIFCGVVCFGRGATNDIGKPYGLNSGECIELIRVALNGNQKSTSKALSIAMRLVLKYAPLTKMLVSFADPDQNHVGTIYQATNWYYVGKTIPAKEYYLDGLKIHGRTFRSKGKPQRAIETMGSSKLRYIYPLHKSLIPLCKSLAKPYPKKQNAAVAHTGEHLASSQEGAFDSTLPLKSSDDGLR